MTCTRIGYTTNEDRTPFTSVYIAKQMLIGRLEKPFCFVFIITGQTIVGPSDYILLAVFFIHEPFEVFS